MTLFSPLCVRKTLSIPITMFPEGNYEYFNDVGLDKLIQDVKKIDDYHVQFTLSEPNAAFLGRLGNGLRLDPLCRVRGRDAEKGDT